MVRFHMLNNEIVQFAAVQQVFYIFQKFIAAALIHRVDNARFFIVKEIRVVRYAFGNRKNPFKHCGCKIVAPHPVYTILEFFY